MRWGNARPPERVPEGVRLDTCASALHAEEASSAAPRKEGRAQLSSAVVDCSGLKQDLDRAALVHGTVTFRDLIERQRQIEDHAGVNFACPDEVDEVGQITANRRRPPVQMHMRVKKLLAIEGQAVRHADIAHMATL